jgi:hypothetical protein
MHLVDKWKKVYILHARNVFQQYSCVFHSIRMAMQYSLSKWWTFSVGENSSLFDTCKASIYSSRKFVGGE